MSKIMCILYILICFFFVLMVVLKHWGFMLTYQHSESMPKGFYLVYPSHNFERGSIVVFHAPKKVRIFLQKHKWLPSSGLMIKYIFALSGDYVCQRNNMLMINFKFIAKLKKYYAPKRLLLKNHFCKVLQRNQFLPLSMRSSRSYDGRYFGPLNENKIVGKAIKL